jgi:hypothetical protein
MITYQPHQSGHNVRDEQDINTPTGTDTVLVVIAHTLEVRESKGNFYTFVFTRKLSHFVTGYEPKL